MKCEGKRTSANSHNAIDIHTYYIGEFGIRDVRYVNYHVTLFGKKAISLPSNLVQRAWFLIPNSPISHSVVRIFIVLGMRFLSPDDA